MDSAAFDKACAQIQTLMHGCQWKQVRDRWLAVLEQHKEQPYVRAARVTIEDDLRQAMYWLQHPAPDMRKLLSGEVVLFDRTNDTIRIRYDTSVPTQFLQTKDAPPPRVPHAIPGFTGKPSRVKMDPVYADFVPYGPIVLHPLEFSGDYSFEIHCSMGSPPPVIAFFLGEDGSYLAKLGSPPTDTSNGVLPTLTRYSSDKTHVDVDAPKTFITLPDDKPYKIFASVTAARITVSLNGRQVLSCAKPHDAFGRFGITASNSYLSIVVNGRSFAQWIDALVDDSVRRDRAQYDKDWRADANLPAWLVKRTQPPVDAASKEAEDRLDKGLSAEATKRISELLHKHKDVECLEYVKSLPHEGDSLLACDFIAATCYARIGRYEDCATAIEPVFTALPALLTARRLRAEAWTQTLAAADALAERKALVDEFPTEAAVHMDLSNAYLHQGKMGDAWSALVAGYARGADTKPLDDQARVLDRAIKGPAWRTTTRVVTKHYEIASELDKDTCALVGKVLEEAYAYYQKTIAHPGELSQPMRVYVFATAEGLHEYCRDLVLRHANKLLGMFSPDLEQLVVCAQPEHAEFLGTVRHEGFHQYLDQVAPNAPVWLNEGMAQYFEHLHAEGGKLDVDKTHLGRHAALKKRTDWNAFGKLIAISREAFYDGADVNYDLAWILVLYLMEAPGPDHAIGTKLMELISSGKADATTVQKAFEGVDMEGLGESVHRFADTLL